MVSRIITLLVGTASLVAAACGGDVGTSTPPVAPLAALDTIDVGATAGSTWPNLAAAEGTIVLSWLEERPDSVAGAPRYRLRVSRRDGGRWTPPVTVVDSADFVVNWADFPAVAPMSGARLAAWWPQRNRRGGAGTSAYDAIVSTSADGGATWSAGVPLHGDGTNTEHGFVAFVPLGAAGDSIGAVWLDGRDYARPTTPTSGSAAAAGAHNMQLAVATLNGRGAPSGERMLDTMVCTCCRTSAARTRRGVVVAYRDRQPGEVRDIAVARYEQGVWSTPSLVHRDGWIFPGCPVNGAVVAAHGDTVAVAWFTAPHDSARVNVAFSTDGGRTFGSPTRIDDGHPAGRAGIVVDGSGAAVVTWIERVAPASSRLPWRAAEQTAKGAPLGGSEVRARRVTLAGVRGAAQTLLVSTEGRASGFPQLAALGDTVYLAWTDPPAGGTPSRVRVARTTLNR